MKKVSISVITCTYNSEEFIRDNIESVWSHNPPDEQIIVDAFSKDKTIEIISEYKTRGYNIKVIERKPAGISDAMNIGFQNATGDLVQVLQSDDYVCDKNLYPKVRNIFYHNSNQWIYGLSRVLNDAGEFINTHPSKMFTKYNYYLLPLINFIPHSTLFIKRKFFMENGLFDVNLLGEMDWDYWLRIAKKNRPLVINEEWTIVRMHLDSFTLKASGSSQHQNEIKLMLKKHYSSVIAEFLYFVNRIIALLRHIVYRKKRYPSINHTIKNASSLDVGFLNVARCDIFYFKIINIVFNFEQVNEFLN